MKPIQILVLITTASCILFSCTTYRFIYTASPPDIPLFKKKGESKVTAYYSDNKSSDITNKYAHGFDLHGAYALSNHWAVTASYLFRREKDYYTTRNSIFDSSDVRYKRHLLDAGVGYFVFLDASKTISGNIYAGVGGGKFSINDAGFVDSLPYNRFHNSSITKWYIMPSLNFFSRHTFRFSFATKFSFVHYGKIRTSYTGSELSYFGLDKIANATLYFLEPAFSFQFGSRYVPWLAINIVSSFTSDYNSYDDSNESHLAVRGGNFSIGMSVDFSKMKKKK
jgi:hypothetical protein